MVVLGHLSFVIGYQGFSKVPFCVMLNAVKHLRTLDTRDPSLRSG
jgi:hypothetical protein